LGYLLVIGAVVLAAWRSQHSLAQAQEVAQRLGERSVQGIRLAAELETLMHERAYVSNYLLSHDHRYLDEAGPHHAQFESWMEQMELFARTEEEKALMAKMRTQYLGYTAKGDEVTRLAVAGQDEQAKQVFFTMKAEVQGLLLSGQELFALAERNMDKRRADADAEMTLERRRIFWLTAVGAAASLLAGFLLARYVSKPLNKLVLRLGAEGGEAQVQFKGDELGILEQQVNALLDRARRQERALQQAQKLSELGEIAAEIAHETLNPLAGARGMLQVLRRGVVPVERLPEELAEVETQLKRVEEIVRRLMRYARPLEPHARKVRLNELVRQALQAAQSSPAAAGRKFETSETPAEEWVLDPELIGQVLVNLLVNACEASPSGSPVELRTKLDGAMVLFEVQDHGTGLSQDQKERLFRPFFTTKPHGNGLGLAVSRNIVLEHGGRIEADSAPGGGSIFKVALPRGELTWAGTAPA
jgi:signal transduction histidine kinase